MVTTQGRKNERQRPGKRIDARRFKRTAITFKLAGNGSRENVRSKKLRIELTRQGTAVQHACSYTV